MTLNGKLAALVVLAFPGLGAAQTGVDMGPSECWSCRDSSPSNSAPAPQQPSVDPAQQQRELNEAEAQALNNEAHEHEKRDEWAEAIVLYERALTLNPNDSVIKENLHQAEIYLRYVLPTRRATEEAARQRAEAEARLQQENAVRLKQHNELATQNIRVRAQAIAQSLDAINSAAEVPGVGGRLELMTTLPPASAASRWLPEGECTALLAENTAALTWARQQASDQGWGFLRDQATPGVARLAGAEALHQAYEENRRALDQALELKEFMERVQACVRGENGKTGCLTALAAEKGQEHAKEWLKGLLGANRDAAERAEAAGKIFQQYVERLQATAQKQALSATRCE